MDVVVNAKPDPVVAALMANRQAFHGFLATRLGDPADVDDVLQDFFLKALTRRGQLRDEDSLVAWLYSILRSTLLDHYRKTGRRGAFTAAYISEMKTAETVVEPDLFGKICACLSTLLPALRPDQAELVRRLDMDEEDRQSVAADLGIHNKTLAVRLHRARQALRDMFFASCSSCTEQGIDDCACESGK